MNAEMPQPEQNTGTAVPAEVSSPKSLVNPKLSGSLMADHAALQNDLVQAQDLAMDFQRQLAGKSNEYAQLKQILEKTQADLAHFQAGIVELRAERHNLANEAMRARAVDYKLIKVTEERDRLRHELDTLRGSFDRKVEEMETQLRERDRRVAELVIESVRLRQAQGGPVAPPQPIAVESRNLQSAPEIEITPEAPRPLRMVR